MQRRHAHKNAIGFNRLGMVHQWLNWVFRAQFALCRLAVSSLDSLWFEKQGFSGTTI